MEATIDHISTRKSSCLNARGIPTAAYQVFHMPSYPGGEGGGRYPRVPLPILTWPGGYLPWPGGAVPSLAGGGGRYLGVPLPYPDLAGGRDTYLG